MNNRNLEKERRKRRRLHRLGDSEPICVSCGEDDDRCLELHHIAGQAYDDAEAIVCRNCHRKLSDDQRDHPPKLGEHPVPLESIGRYLLGLADLFRLIADNLMQFGRQLIDMAETMISPSDDHPS